MHELHAHGVHAHGVRAHGVHAHGVHAHGFEMYPNLDLAERGCPLLIAEDATLPPDLT